MIFRRPTPLSDDMGLIKSLFVELWVDGKPVFRESKMLEKKDQLETVENLLIERMIRNIFTFGVISSKDFLDKHNLPDLTK
jgi:hypothetical protein